MSPDYREPDPWVQANKRVLNVLILAVGLVSGYGFIKAQGSLQVYALVVCGVDFMIWVWLGTLVEPSPVDVWDFWKAKAEEDPEIYKWFVRTDQEFCELWSIDPFNTAREVMSRD